MTIDPGKGAIAARIIQRVAELPDRNSPEDWPDAMLVTGEELQFIIGEEIAPLAEETMRLYRELGASKANLRFVDEERETAERIADTMRDLVDDMTTEVQRLRVRTARAFWGAVVAVGLLAGMQLWRAWA
mgnify:CR=1 FL=1